MATLQLKDLLLPTNVVHSPLAGVSDYPFRSMVRRFSKALIFCEMVKMDALVRHDPNTYHILDYDKSMHPIGAQLCGSKLAYASDAAKIIEDLGFDVLDLNCGCPVDKVTKDGSGSALLKTPDLIGELLNRLVASVSIPVTVKIRCGWDKESINATEITKIAEQAGASAIFIHGRTRVQGYKGPADWGSIRESKAVAKKIKVIGNGDVFSPLAAENMIEQTACDGVLISRGTMGKPWLASDIDRYFAGEKPLEIGEFQALKDHFQHILNYKSGKRALLDLRRVGCWYIKKAASTREIRGKLSKVDSLEHAFSILNEIESG